jgi:exosortase/archaeosortase family protein
MKRFLLLYLLYMVIAFILVDYQPVRQALQLDAYYTGGVVALSAWLIDLLGIHVHAQGAFLHLRHAIMEVKFGCNGLEAILLYVAAVLAYPASWKLRIIGIIAGSTLLQVLNIIRIGILAWVLEYHQKQFALMHEYVTQSIMIALAFIIFLFYLQATERERNTSHA